MIAPGNSIGTLNVAGGITFAAGSTYQIEVNDKGESDKIAATGKATLNGGSVLALVANGSYAPQTRYTILTAAGGVSGTFADVASSLVFLDPTLGYDANSVTLTLSRNDIRFADVATTANQRAAAIGAESLGFSNAAYTALTNLDRDQARFAFDQLSGEIHASPKGMLLQDGLLLNAAATNRIRAAFGDDAGKATPVLAYGEGGIESVAPDTDRFAFWSQAFGTWGDTDGDGNAAGFHGNTGGFLAGADGLVGDAWRVGIIGGYSRSSFDIVDRQSSGDSDNYHIGAYAGAGFGALSLTAGATYSWHRIETRVACRSPVSTTVCRRPMMPARRRSSARRAMPRARAASTSRASPTLPISTSTPMASAKRVRIGTIRQVRQHRHDIHDDRRSRVDRRLLR